MLAATSRSRRMIGLLGAGLVAGALLTGCGGGQTGTAPAAATHPASAAPAADTDAADPAADHADGLAAGLLPADAFGDGATVMAVPLGQLRTMAPLAAAPLAGVDVQPPGCLTALQAMLPRLTAVDDAAVQVARAAGTVSVEALAGPSARVDAVGQLQQLATACSAVDVTAEQYGSAHVSVAPVALPADSGLPDRTTVVAITVAAAGADGRSWNGTALAGVVEDGGRVLALAQAAPQGGTVSSASFTDLLQQAYQTQADAPD
jgi:hypothetical protein